MYYNALAMNSGVKKIILRFLVVLFSAFFVAVIAAALFEDEIGNKIISELNKSIKTKLSVQDVSLSLIRHFPKASATLKKVQLTDLKGGKLLELEELSFSMGLWSVFFGNPEISTIKLVNGLLNVKIDKDGKSNYDIFKDNGNAKGDKNVAFTINQANLEQFTISYSNAVKGSEYKATIQKAKLAGEFSADQYVLDIDSDWFINFIKHENVAYFEEKPLRIYGKFDINNKKGVYQIKECSLDIASNKFALQGIVKKMKDGTDFDLFAFGKDVNLESVSNLGIKKLNDATNRYESKGIIQVNARIDGILNASSNPAVLVQYSLKNGTLEGKDIGGMIDQISFTGSFSNGWSHNLRSSSFSLENCKASFNGLPFSLNLKLKNFEYPDIDFSANGKIPLAKVYEFIPEIQGGSGYVNLKDVNIKGSMADMQSMQGATKVKASGAIQFENAVLNYRGEDLKFVSGNILFSDNFINLNHVLVSGLGTDLDIAGKISNYLPFVFGKSEQDKLGLNIQIKSNVINLEKWIFILSNESAPKPESGESALTDNKPFKQIEGTIRADLDIIKHKKLLAQNFAGELIFENGDMLVSGDVQAMQGDWNVEGQLVFNNGCQLKATLESNKVNIKEFFTQAENFGQGTLTDKNLSGKLNSRILILANWDNKGAFDKNKLHVYGSLSIDNGELIGLKMLENFSTFIKIKDLRDIRFVNLRNLLEIENGVIHIPAMFIQSNAINMTVSGQHSYNSDMEYNFKINAGQLLLNKFGLLNKTTDVLPAKKGGFFNLYYNLKGNAEKYTNKKDKSLVKSNFTRSEIRKHKILNTLLAEFGSMPEFDEPKDWIDDGEKPIPPSFTSSFTNTSTSNAQLKPSLKSTFQEARQTLKNPTKSVPKSDKNTFKDEDDGTEEYLDFK